MDATLQINQIMQRYQLPDDKNLLYSYEEFRKLNLSQEFIFTLLCTFEDEKTFSESEYEKFSLEIIIDYIKRTHRYYLTKKLCEIEQTISILLKDYSGNHPLLHILTDFFAEYTVHLTEHIQAEEKHLLPYIKTLLKFEKEEKTATEFLSATKNYSLQSFIDSHHDTEKDLSDVRITISNYQPPPTNQTPYRILLLQLEAFEKDLAVHALIEDRVLIPRSLKLEKALYKHYSKQTPINK